MMFQLESASQGVVIKEQEEIEIEIIEDD